MRPCHSDGFTSDLRDKSTGVILGSEQARASIDRLITSYTAEPSRKWNLQILYLSVTLSDC